MSGLAIEPDDETIERALKDAARRATPRTFRLYCVACSRSTEATVAPTRPGRCEACGGTMLLELAPD